MSCFELSSPWVEHYKKLVTLFGMDDEVGSIEYDDKAKAVTIRVDNQGKAELLGRHLRSEVTFGNVTLRVNVVPGNEPDNRLADMRHIFEGNPVVSDIVVTENPVQGETTHVMFEPIVVQYFNDDLSHPDGVRTTIYEELARDVFEDIDGVFFNTEVDGCLFED